MKATYVIAFIAILTSYSAFCQRELWSYKVVYNYVNPQAPGINDGQIIKTSLDGNEEIETMHIFDPTGMQGKFPIGRLLLASNGKLYGVTGYGDMVNPAPNVPQGVLFEYDPITAEYRIVSTALYNATAGVIEAAPGVLYGIMNGGNTIFKYIIATETFSIAGAIPSYQQNNSTIYPKFTAELTKGTDGFLYGTTDKAPSSQNITYPGGIYRFDPPTNQITKLYVFGFTQLGLDVIHPFPKVKLIEVVPGKLYGTAYGGVHVAPNGYPAPLGSGTLFEYDIATNTMTKKADFDYMGIGMSPTGIIDAGNGKIYGTLFSINDAAYPNNFGSVYEFDTLTSQLAVLNVVEPAAGEYTTFLTGISCKASNGKFYGSSLDCAFQFDPVANTLSNKIPATYSGDVLQPIEVCRKPTYSPPANASFTICEDDPFVLNINNTNAESYTWKKNDEIIAGQDSAELYLPGVTLSDAGLYTCEMVNECGTTITPPVHLIVEKCLGVDPEPELQNAIRVFPVPAEDVLNIEWPSGTVETLVIANSLGQSVYVGEASATIEIGHLPAGMYYLIAETRNGRYAESFVKQ